MENSKNSWEEEASQPAQNTPAPLDPNTALKVGYLVGVDQEDKFMFETFGTEPTVVGLLGVNNYASQRCILLRDNAMGTGEAVNMQLVKLFNELVHKLDSLISTLRPPNKL